MATTANANAATVKWIRNTEIADQIINGSDETVVQTSGGPVSSLAKKVKDLGIEFEAGVGGIFDTVVGGYAIEAKDARTEAVAANDLAQKTIPKFNAIATADPVEGSEWIAENGRKYIWLITSGHGQWVETGAVVAVGADTTVTAIEAANTAVAAAEAAEATLDSAVKKPELLASGASGGVGIVGADITTAYADGTAGKVLQNVLSQAVQQGSLVDRLMAVTDVSQPYLMRRSATEIAVGCSQGPTKGAEFGLRLDLDGMLLMRGGFTNTLEPASVKVEAVLGPSGFTTSATNATANYATAIGAYFDLPFTGTGLDFNAFGDLRGGLWHFSIDGGAAIPVSVWAATDGTYKHTVAAKGTLTAGAHTCRATYQGADPEHPPTTPVNGRGWLIRDSAGDGVFSTGNALIDGPPSVVATGVRPQVLANNSIPDFAINCRPASEAAMLGKWVPTHGTDSGACRSITRSIFVDGVNIGSDLAVIETFPKALRSLMSFQSYTAFCASDAAGDFPLWDAKLAHKFAAGLMEVTHAGVTLRDVYVAAGYLGMAPTDVRYCDVAQFSNALLYSLAAVARSTNLPSQASSVLFKGSATGNALAVDFTSLQDTLGLGPTKAFAPGMIFLEERVDNVAKVYLRRWDGGFVVPAGTRFQSRVRFFASAQVPMIGVL